MTTLQNCLALDAQDPLRALRNLFVIPEGVIYLDGNSLGVMPKTVPQRIAQAVSEEWAEGLIRSWNAAGWYEMPQRLGDKIAPLVGARDGEVVATDTTSINLYKVLSAAITIAQSRDKSARVIVSERGNFPTDLYIAQALCRERGCELRLVDDGVVAPALGPDVAVLMLTHVNYRTGAMLDMGAITRAAHAAGILTVWDLCHSAGAVPVDLHAADADFAIGCGYKYLNGGPGAPAFVWVHPRHRDKFEQPLAGWWSHAAPFEFTHEYRPAPGIAQYLCGTQPVLSMTALECGLDAFTAAESHGGMAAIRAKSLALTDLFIALVEERCAGHGLSVVTPRDHALRGSQVCLARGDGPYAIVQALIARGVIGDFRAPDILRFGFTPLYTSFEDVWHAAEHLQQVLESGEWRKDEFNRRNAVT
ncbi:kynureninase [Ramlibacter sp. PS4R-6]|uniref:kynureninase n=1 Tax=Ramlibacter sp. PS4R-6 TaxID=3133438 RepID=UPI0030A942FB